MNSAKMVMGGKLGVQTLEVGEDTDIRQYTDVEKYFRPSNLPVLNDRNYNMSFFDPYFQKEESEIILQEHLIKSPEDTIINYFSIMREAANVQEGKYAGCGTLGYQTIPYPVAYQFLASSYKENMSYKEYLKTFLNILHINLIKYRQVPVVDNPNDIIRYFVEIETIEGSEKNAAYFAYYYGFIDIVKEKSNYKISNIEFYRENYLCAPYHGWSYAAEAVIDIKYGGWCKLVKDRLPTKQDGYVKRICFKGTDGNEYLIEFYQLTNDTDIEIAQYIKDKSGSWKLIKLDPEKCLETN
ncbi:hypothetical protein [Anaerocolumna sp.]|uniref:hypothetical protein n=1 Tax=Anaerocolumna sp. TaxID=2041569 RepID=UPI0028AF800C|nr:hypothetical protein [Anaerocolumna sp.]